MSQPLVIDRPDKYLIVKHVSGHWVHHNFIRILLITSVMDVQLVLVYVELTEWSSIFCKFTVDSACFSHQAL